jgi:hypothetical protein
VRVRVDPLRHGGDVPTDQFADIRGYRSSRGRSSSVATDATLPLQPLGHLVAFADADLLCTLFHGSLLYSY